MNWLNKIVDQIIASSEGGEIIVSSGVSPSGKYHLGTLREVLTAEVVVRELKHRKKKAKHIHFVDDLDGLRKIPIGLPEDFSQYLGQSLCLVPSPVIGFHSYAEYFLSDLVGACKTLNLKMDIQKSHVRYREGFFTPAIESALNNITSIRNILENVSGHKLGDEWSPIQINEDGYLKKRQFVSLDPKSKTLVYKDKSGKKQKIDYSNGMVKLDWRIDWPARWWLLGVNAEPFGRDHASAGGSYDTGAQIVKNIFGTQPPIPVAYDFINKTGDTKKMSKSAGDTVNLAELLEILPPEVVWFFVIRYEPSKLLYFDQNEGVVRLIDEYAELLAKVDKNESERQLIRLCSEGLKSTISQVPFSLLVSSYQAALKDKDQTINIISRTEHSKNIDKETIHRELDFIDNWLKSWAPEDVKFELRQNVNHAEFTEQQRSYFMKLAYKIENAPKDADGEWFHKVIYEFKESGEVIADDLFKPLYKLLIGKTSGPRAGWFLSILPRDWLVKRLMLEV